MTIAVLTGRGVEVPWPHQIPPRVGDQIFSATLGLFTVAQVRWVVETGYCEVRVHPVGAMYDADARRT